jgi:cobalt transport protein ATP-binding subunit
MAEPVLFVRGLRYTYPGGRVALGGVDFQLEPGEHVALIGPNGAGKSTLIQHLNGILLGEGELRVGGVPVGKKTLKEVRRRVGVVFQDPDDQLFCPTLEADVAFGPRNFGVPELEVAPRVDAALEVVELAHLRTRPPFQLSFGERRRAALATVLACDPDVVVLDEPSANLDPRHRRRLIDWLKAHPGTVLVATHDLDLALEATSRCLLLDGGQLIADGPSEVLLRDRALLEAHALELPLRLQGWP